MPSVVKVAIHASQFPENVRRDLLESLRTRQVNHKFHYDSVKQTQKWLALHQACSPSRNDSDCAATYDRSFEAVSARINPAHVHLIGLGCGGGQKDARLLELLKRNGKRVAYTPSDVSVAMVLVARQTALSVISEKDCHPFVCDLATADDLTEIFDRRIDPDATRLVTFFGMIPNFEPEGILPRLVALLRHGDYLLFSANLAPGPNYAAGVQRILPQYDNVLTRDWLMTFLLDLGVDRDDGDLRFTVEDGQCGLKRVTAYFHFSRSRAILLDDERFVFSDGEAIRLFFSYRYTSGRVRSLLNQRGLEVLDQWIARSEEEGVYLCQRM
ncbi:MAG: L-histidine N(alpha)-methyltransferase [Verrucomicrobia bacterium]|nr:L-histidine N(alpha)-methyltransferase [Verrucomicrobiota bacterium]